MENKWYNSSLAGFTGIAILCLGIGSCYYLGKDSFNIPKYPLLQKADLNKNNRNEEFYTIDGKVAVTEIDGEPILDFLRSQEKKK